MKILTIGSMNLDFVYQMEHIVGPGETEAARYVQRFPGGKGMNQSIAMAKAGAEVYHAGMIGQDGKIFLDVCKEYGIHSEYIQQSACATGHAIIQRDKTGQNSIVLYGGANQMLTRPYVEAVLADFSEGDLLVLQNEVNLLPFILEKADAKGMQILLNPSPFRDTLLDADMHKVHTFLLNEIEGRQMTGQEEPGRILDRLLAMYPDACAVLTLGAAGAVYGKGEQRIYQAAFPVPVVDTTAAGDTFTGYFAAGYAAGLATAENLEICAMAAALAVTAEGAVPSIPYRDEVMKMLKTQPGHCRE